MDEIIKKNEKPKKSWIERYGTFIFLTVVVALFLIFGPSKPSGCDCMDNLDIGYYDALSEKNREFRDECLKAYAGRAGMWLDCYGK